MLLESKLEFLLSNNIFSFILFSFFLDSNRHSFFNARASDLAIMMFSTNFLHFWHSLDYSLYHTFMKSRSRDGLAAKGLSKEFQCRTAD